MTAKATPPVGPGAAAEPTSAGALGSDPIASPPPGRARAVASAVIALWLVLQVAVPLSYYLGSSISDERFAWRMFSSVSVFATQCVLTAVETVAHPGSPDGRITREPDLNRLVHAAWLVHLRRGRSLVTERFLDWRCQQDPSIIEIELKRSCSRGPEAGTHEARRQCPAAAAAGESSR